MPLAHVTIEDDVARLVLDRAEKRNALSRELIQDALAGLKEARDATPRALILQGEGPIFCAGGDIAWMKQRVDDPQATKQALEDHLAPLIESLATFPAPTISEVHGAALGAGLGLALACDVPLATHEAQLGATHARLGLTPDGGTSWFLARQLGPTRALDLILSARTFTAEQAQAWGLIAATFPPDALNHEATKRARTLAQGPTQAYRTARTLVHDAMQAPLSTVLKREAAAQGAMYKTKDQTEGVHAFLEDRDPTFQGR